jgi:hypothetical protein
MQANSSRNVNGYETFSQAYQDLFVRIMTEFKEYGTYLEVGASDSKDNNNTYILERDFSWTGFSIEIDKKLSDEFNLERKNLCLNEDATEFDFITFFSKTLTSNRIDYLSLDIEPSINTLKVLMNIPLDKVRFSVITFEHDLYLSGNEVMLKSRELLTNYGYTLVTSNVMSNGRDFEDWYVDPRVVRKENYLPYQKSNIEAIDLFKEIKIGE